MCKQKIKKMQLLKSRIKDRVISNLTEIFLKLREYYDGLYVNISNNLGEMDKFLGRQRLKLTQEEKYEHMSRLKRSENFELK